MNNIGFITDYSYIYAAPQTIASSPPSQASTDSQRQIAAQNAQEPNRQHAGGLEQALMNTFHQMELAASGGSSIQASTPSDTDGDNDVSATQTSGIRNEQNSFMNSYIQTIQDQNRLLVSGLDSNPYSAGDVGRLLFANDLSSIISQLSDTSSSGNSLFSELQGTYAILLQAMVGQQQIGGTINNVQLSHGLQDFLKTLQQNIASVREIQAIGNFLDTTV